MNKINLFFIIFAIIFFDSYGWIDVYKNSNISYIFAPGSFTHESYMSRYLPSFIASTNELITCSKGIEVLRLPASACNFPEIDLKKKLSKSHCFLDFLNNSKKKIIFCLTRCINNLFGIKIKNIKKEISLSAQTFEINKFNIAQDSDIEYFKKCYAKHLYLNSKNETVNQEIVLYGASRGAATVFNFLALYKPKEVRAVICEGIFDSIPNLLQYKFSVFSPIFLKIIELFTSFKQNGTCPIFNLNKIPLNVPILLVTSLKDHVVPSACAINLYKRLKERGHTKVHILILTNAGHNSYVTNREDKIFYEQVVHAFYEYYNLPHIEKFSIEGKKYFLEKTNPIF